MSVVESLAETEPMVSALRPALRDATGANWEAIRLRRGYGVTGEVREMVVRNFSAVRLRRGYSESLREQAGREAKRGSCAATVR